MIFGDDKRTIFLTNESQIAKPAHEYARRRPSECEAITYGDEGHSTPGCLRQAGSTRLHDDVDDAEQETEEA